MGISRHRVNVVLSEEEHAEVAVAAEEEMMSMSAFARKILLTGIRARTKGGEPPPGKGRGRPKKVPE